MMQRPSGTSTPPDTYGFTQHLLSLLRHLERTRPDRVRTLLVALAAYSTGFCTNLQDYSVQESLSRMRSSAGLSDGSPAGHVIPTVATVPCAGPPGSCPFCSNTETT
jgi:hypothetical protein